jgi:hypothetical protein
MPWLIYEFLDAQGDRVMAVWFKERKIQKNARILFEQKVDLLEQYGPDLPPNLLAPVAPHIYKFKVRGQGVQLRPHLCQGPLNHRVEFTFLCGAIEKGGKLDPVNVAEQAGDNRNVILQDSNRRGLYERFVPKATR